MPYGHHSITLYSILKFCDVIFVVATTLPQDVTNQLLPAFLVVNQKGKKDGVIPPTILYSYASNMQQKSSLF